MSWPTAFVTALGLLISAGCESELTPQFDMGQVPPEGLVGRHFGPEFDIETRVAQVEQHVISIGDLAVCLEQAPVLSVATCLDTLVAALLAEDRATAADRAAPAIADARVAALASAFVRERVERVHSPESLSRSDLDSFLVDPANRLYLAGPELRECSHLLVQSAGGASPEASAMTALIGRRYDWPQYVTEADLEGARRRFSAEAAELGLTLRVERHFTAHLENAGADAWPGLSRVAQPFADALFAIERPGQLSGPVATEFGGHLILLERVFSAVELSPDEALSLARHELTQRRRLEALGQLIVELQSQAEIRRYRTSEIFRLDDEALIRERSSAIRDSLGRD